MDINVCTFTGHLGADPELRTTSNGISVCTMSLAVERMKTKGEDKAETDWLSLVAWRQNAEYASRYLTKGAAVTVQAHVAVRKWTDKNGQARTSTEFIVDQIKGQRSRTAGEPTAQSYGRPSSQPGDFRELPDDGDLPF